MANEIRIVKGSIDDIVIEGNPCMRGVIATDSLQHLQIDKSYQREFLSATARRYIMDALDKKDRPQHGRQFRDPASPSLYPGGRRSRTPTPPGGDAAPSLMNTTPRRSSAASIRARFGEVILGTSSRAFSARLTVDSDVPACAASSAAEICSRPNAADICLPESIVAERCAA